MGNTENEIQEIVAQRIRAIKEKDVTASVSVFSEDVISFDLITPIQNHGLDAVRARLENWFSTMLQLNDFDMTEVQIEASETLAFCSSLNHIDATNHDGSKNDMWWRETSCYKKIDGVWRIKHIHASSPFNMKTGKAATDAKPIKEKNIN